MRCGFTRRNLYSAFPAITGCRIHAVCILPCIAHAYSGPEKMATACINFSAWVFLGGPDDRSSISGITATYTGRKEYYCAIMKLSSANCFSSSLLYAIPRLTKGAGNLFSRSTTVFNTVTANS